MNIVIFAGGTGRRLWPISRQASPKQFEPIIGEKSTLRMAVERVLDAYGPANIYISTNQRYQDIVERQLPELPEGHVIGEPARRDVAPAVGLAMAKLMAEDPTNADEPVAILWGDNLMENVEAFHDLLATAAQLLNQDAAEIVFVGETARYANENLGWLGFGEQLGKVDDTPYYRFESLVYRPPQEGAQRMYEEGTHVWNTGYFVTTPAFVMEMFRAHQPEMWSRLDEIRSAMGGDDYQETLARIYPAIESVSFDDAVLQHVDPQRAVVLHGRLGWSDPGTLYALKETINPDSSENVSKGLVIETDSEDCLILNYESDKLVAAIGLEGMIVVNTEDALLVVHKDNIRLVKQVVNDLRGTELEKYS